MTEPKYNTSDSKSSAVKPLFDDSDSTNNTDNTNLKACPATLPKPA